MAAGFRPVLDRKRPQKKRKPPRAQPVVSSLISEREESKLSLGNRDERFGVRALNDLGAGR